MMLVNIISINIMDKQKKIDSIDLSKMNTLLSNQRTYLSYIRTGLSIIGFATVSNNYFLFICGCVILLKGVYQYYNIRNDLTNNEIRFTSLVNLYDISILLIIMSIFYWFYYKDIDIFTILKKKK
jgi:uncharacterized membrane protein YidH (DUF202 family)